MKLLLNNKVNLRSDKPRTLINKQKKSNFSKVNIRNNTKSSLRASNKNVDLLKKKQPKC